MMLTMSAWWLIISYLLNFIYFHHSGENIQTISLVNRKIQSHLTFFQLLCWLQIMDAQLGKETMVRFFATAIIRG
jgi:hypothetical protein